MNIDNFVHALESVYEVRQVSTDNVAICCPFCTDSTYNMWIGVAKNGGVPSYHCWKCDAGGSLYKLFKILGLSLEEDFIYEIDDGSIYDELKEQTKFKSMELPTEYIDLTSESKSVVIKKAIDYLHARKVDDDKIAKYRLGFCPTGRYGERVIIPVYNQSGVLEWFLGRSIYPKTALKVLNPPKDEYGIGKSNTIFNLNNNLDKDCVIINEGVFDAITTDGLAIFGKTLSDWQFKIIKNIGASEIIIMLDSDAIKSAYKMAEQLYLYKDVYICELPDGKDPNDLSEEEMKSILGNKILYDAHEKLKFQLRL